MMALSDEQLLRLASESPIFNMPLPLSGCAFDTFTLVAGNFPSTGING